MSKNIPITPVNGRYLIETVEKKSITDSGFVLPDSATDKTSRSSEGVILAIPESISHKDGKDTVPKFKAGQIIYFGSYNGTEVNVGEKKYLLLHEDDIVGIKN